MNNKKEIGDFGEALARKYLRRHFYRIVETNYKTKHGEIDIIAKKGRYLIFCEVKSRRAEHTELYGRPAYAVNYKKREHIRYCIRNYLARSNTSLKPRIDIIEVYLSEKGHRIEHIKDAFGAEG
ncbi:MAG: YraN family protein [Clostridia bacterium]|nr:YraN family protein [Clostridia bacterium]